MNGIDIGFLIIMPLIVPLIAGLIAFIRQRWGSAAAIICSMANCLVIPLLAAQVYFFGSYTHSLGGWTPPLGISLRLDEAAVFMLFMTAIVGTGISLYARGYFSFRIGGDREQSRHHFQQRYFWPLWMLMLAALNSLFLAGDIFNIYVILELIGVSAAALAALSGKPSSQIASFRYLMVSLLGSLSYLLGVALLYRTYAVLDLQILRSTATAGPAVMAALTLMSIGLLLKTAIFPLHFWLPPAHANALAPVSAILSGLVVKGSFYLLFRLWFDTFATVIPPAAHTIIGILGAGAILWGAAQALIQQRLKLLIAYSTVSQLGYLCLLFPIIAGSDIIRGWEIVFFMAGAHACAKSAMFMAAGSIFLQVGHDRINDLAGIRSYLPVTVFAFAIAGVNLMGLPPSGGFIAKWLMMMTSIENQNFVWAMVIMAGSLLASAYVYKVMRELFVSPAAGAYRLSRQSTGLMEWPALILAIFSLLMGMTARFFVVFLHGGGAV